MPDVHATLSASGSAKWLACPAALALEALINEPDNGSQYADEGTAAHSLLEMSLSQGKEPSNFLGRSVIIDEGKPSSRMLYINQEMVDNVEIALEYIGRLTARNAFYEERVDYSHIAPGGFGTADVVLEVYDKVAPDKRVNTLYVIDFKYGAGVKVEAYENSQGMLYALGALNSLDPLFDNAIERIMVVIIQPRMDHIDEYEISVPDLMRWGESIKPKAEHASSLYRVTAEVMDEQYLKPQYFNPTKKGCKWCQGKRTNKCKAYAQLGYSAAVEGFDDLTAEEKTDLASVEVSAATLKDPVFLDSSELVAVYKSMSTFADFLKSVDDEVRKRLQAGDNLPGLKLIPTEKARAWKLDPDATVKALRTSGLQKKHYEKISLISPTEAEKLLKTVKPKEYKRRYRKLEDAAIHRPAGKDKIIEDHSKSVKQINDQLDELLT